MHPTTTFQVCFLKQHWKVAWRLRLYIMINNYFASDINCKIMKLKDNYRLKDSLYYLKVLKVISIMCIISYVPEFWVFYFIAFFGVWSDTIKFVAVIDNI